MRTVRSEKKWSVREAARRAGVSDAYWGSLERKGTVPGGGPDSRPSVGWLRNVAEALGINPADLFELAGHDQDAAWERARKATTVSTGHATGEARLSLSDLDAADFETIDRLRRERPEAFRKWIGVGESLLDED
jgi:transcriptional regulator with XRE-family HTH domain